MYRKYIRKTVKMLRCAKEKREKIKKQLYSEVAAGLEAGEAIEIVMERMGKPEEIAEEFNRSFSLEEEKKYKKEKRGKLFILIAAVLFLLLTTVYWVLPKSRWLEDSNIFRKEEVKEKAEEIIVLVETDNYTAIQDAAIEALKPYFTGEVFLEGKELIAPDWGERESLGAMYVSEVTQMGVRLAVVQVNVSYKNAAVTYTISFNEEMELAGLYIR